MTISDAAAACKCSRVSAGSQMWVYVEGIFGQDRLDLQTLISKDFSPRGRSGLLSITSAQATYNNDTDEAEF